MVLRASNFSESRSSLSRRTGREQTLRGSTRTRPIGRSHTTKALARKLTYNNLHDHQYRQSRWSIYLALTEKTSGGLAPRKIRVCHPIYSFYLHSIWAILLPHSRRALAIVPCALKNGLTAAARQPVEQPLGGQLLHANRWVSSSINGALSIDLCTFSWSLLPVVYSEKSQDWGCDSVDGSDHLWMKGRILVETWRIDNSRWDMSNPYWLNRPISGSLNWHSNPDNSRSSSTMQYLIYLGPKSKILKHRL